MSISFVDVPLGEVVSRACEAVQQGQSHAFEALDRHLRWHLVRYLQDRTGDPAELSQALLEACHWVQRERQEPWVVCWPYLMELLEDAESQPAVASDLQALRVAQGRAAEMLALLVGQTQPLRPNDVSDRLNISIQQVSNLGKKLEDAGLIVRRQASGRSTWLFPTRRGIQLAKLLPATEPVQHIAQTDQERSKGEALTFWSPSALDQSIHIH